jgi:hypothetical protein
MQIEIHRWQVADLIRANPGIPKRDLHDLIVQSANDRRGDHHYPVYAGDGRTELGAFIELVRVDMENGTAHIR